MNPSKYFLPFSLSCAVSLSLAGPAVADRNSIPAVAPLLKQGLPALALAIHDQSEPDVSDVTAWSQWLQRKVTIAGQARDWDVVVDQWRQLAGESPTDELRLWVSTQVAEAYVDNHQGEAARRMLLPLLWSGPVATEQVRQWRWLMVRSYLDEQRYEDGYDALLRYQQDYAGASGEAVAGVKAELLLALARDQEAVVASTGLSSSPGRAVHLVARARLGLAVSLAEGLAAAPLLTDPAVRGDTRTALVQTLVSLAGGSAHGPQRVDLFERLVSAGAADAAGGLWDSYEGYGAFLANQLQLLEGDYAPWMTAAQRLEQTSAVQAKAIYGWLALNASPQYASRGHDHLAALLEQGQRDVLPPLYLNAARFTDDTLPAVIADRLLASALSARDSVLAHAMLARLDDVSGQVAVIDLELHRAAVLMLDGEFDSAAVALVRVIDSGNSLDTTQLNRYLDVALALLAEEQIVLGYGALEAALQRLPELGARQQVLYWMAQARLAEQRYAEAAAVFVMAATVLGEAPVSDWSQQAWFDAAHAMELAGLSAEAGKVYEKLLQASADEARRFLLRRHLLRLAPMTDGQQEPLTWQSTTP